MNLMLTKLCYPEAFIITPKEMIDKHKNVCVVAIPDEEYENFRSLCKTNKVDYCMSTEYKVQGSEHMSMLFPAKDVPMMDAILTRLSRETEEFHLMMGILEISAY